MSVARRRAIWIVALTLNVGTVSAVRAEQPVDADTAKQQAGAEVIREYRTTCRVNGADVEVELRMRINKASLTVADRVEMILEMRVPVGARVRWPQIDGAALGLNVLGVEDEPTRGSGAGTPRSDVWRRVVLLEPFLPGERELPSMEVGVESGGVEAPCVLRTEAIALNVTSLLTGEDAAGKAAEPELRGVVDAEPAPSRRWLWVASIGAGAVMAAAVGVMAWKSRDWRPEEELTAYGAAIHGLEQLEAQGGATGIGNGYFAQLGEILRRYLASALGLPAAGRTTEQLLAEVGNRPALNVEGVGSLLRRLDEAGFSGDNVDPGEANELRDRVYKMIVGLNGALAPEQQAAAAKGGAS